MARQILKHTNAHTYGVLDPLMIERRDTKYVQNSLANGLNAIIVPQGGYHDRGGSDHIAVLRNHLDDVSLTAGMIAAPNGGTVANLIDDDPLTLFTTGAVSGNPFVLFTITLPAPTAVSFVDLISFSAEVAGDACLKVQYFNGSVWVDMPPGAQNIRPKLNSQGKSIEHSRRFGFPPVTPPQLPSVLVTQVRAVITGGAGPGAITLGRVEIKTEAAPPVKPDAAVARRYAYSADRFYTLILTPGNCDIFRKDEWIAACAMPSTDAMIPGIKHLPSDDTILFFHQDMEPWRIQRQGSDSEWMFGPVPWENIPRADYGAVYTNGVNEIQMITLYGINPGKDVVLTLEGEEATAVATGPADNEIQAADVKAALEALPNVDPGLTVTTSGRVTTVEFTGGANAARPWTVMTARTGDLDGAITVSRSVKGKIAGEDIMSDLRGWPAVGRYVQQRLIIAGFRSRPKSFAMSVTGEVFNLDSERVGATGGRVYDIDDDDTNVIRDIHIARTILFFLDGSVWAMEFQVISAEDTPKLFRSDSPGIMKELRPVSVSNRLFYPQRGGQTLRTLIYSELEQNFLADNASVLSASLFDQPIDSALRRGIEGNDAELLMLPLANGDMVVITLLPDQDVSGFMTLRTQGRFVSLAIDPDETVWLVCSRGIDGQRRNCLERMEPKKVLDAAIEFTYDPPQSHITGLSQFNGQTVEIIADGDYGGNYLIEGGVLDLAQPVTALRVGTWVAPFTKDTPFHSEDFMRVPGPVAKLIRNYAVELSLLETTSVAIAANGDIARNVDLRDYDKQNMDEPLSLLPFTGHRRIEGLPGFTKGGELIITQVFPGKLILRSVTKEYAV